MVWHIKKSVLIPDAGINNDWEYYGLCEKDVVYFLKITTFLIHCRELSQIVTRYFLCLTLFAKGLAKLVLSIFKYTCKVRIMDVSLLDLSPVISLHRPVELRLYWIELYLEQDTCFSP